jgi:small subunit ribosomal protein S16
MARCLAQYERNLRLREALSDSSPPYLRRNVAQLPHADSCCPHSIRWEKTTAVAVKIKLKRMGKIREPYYRIIVADARTKRDGRAIEEIGKYHPKAEPSFIEVNSDRAQHWLSVGAQPTDPVRKILEITGDWQKFKGLPGTEGTLKTAAERTDKKQAFAVALAETLAESGTTPKGKARSGGARTADAKSGDAKSGDGKSGDGKGKGSRSGGKQAKDGAAADAPPAKADEPAKAEPAKAESPKAEPAKADEPLEAKSAETESPKAESPKADEPAEAESPKAEPAKADEPLEAKSAETESPKAESPKADEPAEAEPAKVDEPAASASEDTAVAAETQAGAAGSGSGD